MASSNLAEESYVNVQVTTVCYHSLYIYINSTEDRIMGTKFGTDIEENQREKYVHTMDLPLRRIVGACEILLVSNGARGMTSGHAPLHVMWNVVLKGAQVLLLCNYNVHQHVLVYMTL